MGLVAQLRTVVILGITLASSAWAEPAAPTSVAEALALCRESEDRDPPKALALAEQLLTQTRGTEASERAEALGCRGWALASLGEVERARRDAFDLRGMLPQIAPGPDRLSLARRVGGILHRTGDRVGAIEMYAAVVSEAEALGLEAERIAPLVNLGVIHSEFGDYRRAEVNYTQALDLMERLDDRRHEVPVRYNLGLNLGGQERNAEAVLQLERALALLREAEAPPGRQVMIMLALAASLQDSGDSTGARALIAELRAMDAPLDDPGVRVSVALIDSAERAEAGDLEAALALLDGFNLDGMLHQQQYSLLEARIKLLDRLGRTREALALSRQLLELSEGFLRSQNTERLAAFEAHLRDREQRTELQRLEAEADLKSRALEKSTRRWWQGLLVGSLLLLALAMILFWQQRMNRRLDRVSRSDPLTGLSNRRDMGERLRLLAARPDEHGAVLLVDIDHFKEINDRFGHDMGDAILVAFARRLVAAAGPNATVARWGGEEFLILLPHADQAAARGLAERLRSALAEPLALDERRVPTPVSIGFCNLPLPDVHGRGPWHHSLQLADAALYLAKGAGRDAWAGVWVTKGIPGWPPDRLAREFALARTLGLVVVESSRALADPVVDQT
jgi:diguanylate cyclase (GGDEF)-like protein